MGSGGRREGSGWQALYPAGAEEEFLGGHTAFLRGLQDSQLRLDVQKQMNFACLPACHKTQPLQIRSPKPQALTLSRQPSAGMHILLLRLTSACSAMLLYLSEEVMPEVMSRAWASQVRTPMVPSNGPSRNDLHVCMGCAWGDPQGTFAWPRANGFAPQEEQEEE